MSIKIYKSIYVRKVERSYNHSFISIIEMIKIDMNK